MATDHRHALSHFLRTDRHRIEAALDGVVWDSEIARRLGDHLRFIAQVQAVYVEGCHPQDESLQRRLAALAPQNRAEAQIHLAERHEALHRALAAMRDERFDAPVIEPLDRGLTVLGHLYDLTRSSAALVAWLQAQDTETDEGSLTGWFG